MSVYIKSKDEKRVKSKDFSSALQINPKTKIEKKIIAQFLPLKNFNLDNSVNYIKSEDQHYSIQENQILL